MPQYQHIIVISKLVLFVLILLPLAGLKTSGKSEIYKSDTLIVKQLTKNTFVHISFLDTEHFGKVTCNGMIVMSKNKAIIFDTPTTDLVSNELIDWISRALDCKTIGVVVNHFHNDCLGGLNAFHDRNIPSYASHKTIELAKAGGVEIPKTGFDTSLILNVGRRKVNTYFMGEGHTVDNTVSYFPKDKVLFGGCLIKGNNAGKGYLGDANIDEWSKTVRRVSNRFKKVKIVIPGHGDSGSNELFDYTIDLFQNE